MLASELISDPKVFDSILHKLFPSPPSKIAIAVSGGADSLCLLFLLKRWADPLGISLYPLIVNHNLKSTDAWEAQQAFQWIVSWGLKPCILSWDHPPLRSGLMEKARYGRYQVLALACHQLDIRHLFIGHHQDELLETVLIRRQRGSHWRGLAGLSAIRYWYGLMLIRPLLAFPKHVLEQTLRLLGQPWIIDSLNSHPKFMRTHARHYLRNLSLSERNVLLKQVHDYGQRRQEEAQTLSSSYQATGEGYLKILWEDVVRFPPEEGGVLLKAWIETFSARSLDSHMLRSLWIRLKAIFKGPRKMPQVLGTGGGCLFTRHQDHLYIFRERGRIAVPDPLSKNFIWDHRFFCYGIPVPQISPLPKGAWLWRSVKASFPHSWPHRHMLYRPCGIPYPYFTVTDFPVSS